MNKNTIKTGFLASIILLSGCVYVDESSKNQENLDDKISKSLNKEAEVEDINIPDIKKGQEYTYQNSELKSPFSTNKVVKAKGDIFPDLNRAKDPLEEYALSSITMKGTLAVKNSGKKAMLLTSDGKIHQAKVGNYMGQNYGKITQITDESMTLRELFKDSNGVWFIKMTTVERK